MRFGMSQSQVNRVRLSTRKGCHIVSKDIIRHDFGFTSTVGEAVDSIPAAAHFRYGADIPISALDNGCEFGVNFGEDG
jgi:hypothetical protein